MRLLKKCEGCGSPNHTTNDHYDIEWFKRGLKWCWEMTYSCTTKGYALSDIMFDEKRGTIFNSNKEIVMITPRVRDVYVLDMTSSTQESISNSRTENGTEFKNSTLVNFYDEKVISKNFSSFYTPEQNSVAERKNKTLIKAARTMLSGSVFSKQYWTEAVATACYTQNRSIIFTSTIIKIIYENLMKKLMMVIFMDTHLSPKHSESSTLEDKKLKKPITSHLIKSLRLLNSQNLQLTPSTLLNQKDIHLMNIFILMNLLKDQNDQPVQNDEIINDDHFEHSNRTNDEQIIDNLPNTEDIQISEHLSCPNTEWSQDKHIELVNIISNPGAGMLTRARAKTISAYFAYECLFVDFARLEAIRIFLAFATYMNFIVYHMDVKSAFLNGKLKEEVYVKQPPDIRQILRNPTLLLLREFSGGKLVCWSAKKQQSVAMSSAESEYEATTSCYVNILLMKSQITANDIIYEKVTIFCDNTSAIAISNNLVLHSRTKHIDIRYHFIRDHILKGDIELHFIPTQYQLADIFTKPLDEPNFKRLIVELGYNGEIREKETLKKSYLPPRWRLLMGQIISALLDYAKIIWEDLIHKLNKKTREKIVPYPRFISLLLKHMEPKYDTEELTINPTQAICNLDVHVDSIAPKYSSPTEEVPQGKKPGARSGLKRKKSSKHTPNLSHPSPATPVVGEMHKEAQQAAGGPTSLGDTSEDGAHP
ncbi:retrovirus-related pol polyprotein from transposon TNT 1-94 [Tanacetum coccineum]|uniref:Retrovirus-related pol polyprotein from transposon TNT 1-94 n=1 Tax=Tanacetum coccineum TaxID=301880 RepID=A0ABQ5C7Q9_9ASTR